MAEKLLFASCFLMDNAYTGMIHPKENVMKTLRPLFFLASLLLIVGLACGALGGGSPPPQPTQPSQQEPSKAPEPTTAPTDLPPTKVPPTEVPPTPKPTELPAFFTEEFDGDLNNWTYFVNYGEETGVELGVENAKLNINITSEQTSMYVFYTPYIYTDVVLEAKADNAGKNNNNVSLVCRYNEADVTWYEFNIANNGLYWILAFVDNDYKEIYSGGSNLIKQGRDTNVYKAGCVGNELSLFINGQEVRTLQEKTYGLKEGQVGLSVTSFDVLPIEIDFEYFTIAER
ncbi:MAG: hypothetical protein ACXW4U_06075 [Anaerolineales bacterium]